MLANRDQRALEMEAMEDRVLLAGTVDVSLADGALSVTGDGSGNQVFVTQLPDGQYLVFGLGTQISVDGEIEGVTQTGIFSATIDAELVESIDVDLGEGFNTFIGYDFSTTLGEGIDPISSLSIAAGSGIDNIILAQLSIPTDISVNAGDGADNVILFETETGGNTNVALGPGINIALLYNVTTTGDLNVTGGAEIVDMDPSFLDNLTFSDIVLGTGLNIGGNATVNTQDGNDVVGLAGNFDGNLSVDLGSESDVVAIDGSVIGTLDLIGGSGTDVGILLPALTVGTFTNAEFEFDFGFDINI